MCEILAPAGDEAAFFAALHSGADAVYLGLQNFSARAGAANFTAERLAQLIRTAHMLGVRVHAAERDAAGAAQARMDGAFSLAIGSFFNAYGDAQALWDMDMRLSGLARESEALAQALDDLAGARSESARRAALRRAEAAVVEEARCVPLCATQRAWLCRPEWAGVALTPSGDLLLCRARRADAQE